MPDKPKDQDDWVPSPDLTRTVYLLQNDVDAFTRANEVMLKRGARRFIKSDVEFNYILSQGWLPTVLETHFPPLDPPTFILEDRSDDDGRKTFNAVRISPATPEEIGASYKAPFTQSGRISCAAPNYSNPPRSKFEKLRIELAGPTAPVGSEERRLQKEMLFGMMYGRTFEPGELMARHLDPYKEPLPPKFAPNALHDEVEISGDAEEVKETLDAAFKRQVWGIPAVPVHPGSDLTSLNASLGKDQYGATTVELTLPMGDAHVLHDLLYSPHISDRAKTILGKVAGCVALDTARARREPSDLFQPKFEYSGYSNVGFAAIPMSQVEREYLQMKKEMDERTCADSGIPAEYLGVDKDTSVAALEEKDDE